MNKRFGTLLFLIGSGIINLGGHHLFSRLAGGAYSLPVPAGSGIIRVSEFSDDSDIPRGDRLIFFRVPDVCASDCTAG